jgi:hypothetical protein
MEVGKVDRRGKVGWPRHQVGLPADDGILTRIVKQEAAKSDEN